MTYYAQLRGFLQDQYCSKSAVITWLIPKVGEADEDRRPLPSEFDPKYYVAGITDFVLFFFISSDTCVICGRIMNKVVPPDICDYVIP